MNLTQFALMTYHTTGVGQTAMEYFSRAALTGDEIPVSLREAERVIEFCQRVQRATPQVLPGCEDGEPGHEGNDLWCEANEVALRLKQYIEREAGGDTARPAGDAPAPDTGRAAPNAALLDAAAWAVACHEGGTDQDHYELVSAMEELRQAVEAARGNDDAPPR